MSISDTPLLQLGLDVERNSAKDKFAENLRVENRRRRRDRYGQAARIVAGWEEAGRNDDGGTEHCHECIMIWLSYHYTVTRTLPTAMSSMREDCKALCGQPDTSRTQRLCGIGWIFVHGSACSMLSRCIKQRDRRCSKAVMIWVKTIAESYNVQIHSRASFPGEDPFRSSLLSWSAEFC